MTNGATNDDAVRVRPTRVGGGIDRGFPGRGNVFSAGRFDNFLGSFNANLFPAVTVDATNGNVYATWSNSSGAGTKVYYSFSVPVQTVDATLPQSFDSMRLF